MKLFNLVLFFSLCLGLSSCGDGDGIPGGCDNNFAQEFQDELNDISEAASNWATEQTTEACEAYIDAYQDYLNALEDWDECALWYGNQDEWQQAIDDTQDDLDDFEC